MFGCVRLRVTVAVVIDRGKRAVLLMIPRLAKGSRQVTLWPIHEVLHLHNCRHVS